MIGVLCPVSYRHGQRTVSYSYGTRTSSVLTGLRSSKFALPVIYPKGRFDGCCGSLTNTYYYYYYYYCCSLGRYTVGSGACTAVRMALYGATSIARVVPGHAVAGQNGGRSLKGKGAMATLVRPVAWTKACAWKPAGACYGVDGGHSWDDENSTVRSKYATTVDYILLYLRVPGQLL